MTFASDQRKPFRDRSIIQREDPVDDLSFMYSQARERQQQLLAEAEQDRLAALARTPQLSLSRRIARPLGKLLIGLGAVMLRYGRVQLKITQNNDPAIV